MGFGIRFSAQNTGNFDDDRDVGLVVDMMRMVLTIAMLLKMMTMIMLVMMMMTLKIMMGHGIWCCLMFFAGFCCGSKFEFRGRGSNGFGIGSRVSSSRFEDELPAGSEFYSEARF